MTESTSMYNKFFNIEAEMSLLGSVLINNGIFDEVTGILKPIHFFSDIHQKIYLIMIELYNNSKPIDIITVSDYAAYNPKYKTDVTFEYLTKLTNSIITLQASKDYALLINDLFLSRRIQQIQTIIPEILEGNDTTEAKLHKLESTVISIAEDDNNLIRDISFPAALTKAIMLAEKAKIHKGNISGVTTGLIDLNKKLGGLQRSDLIVLAARPSMGKTALATNIAFKAAAEWANNNHITGAPALIFSLEMSSEQIAARILSTYTGISGDLIRKGMISDGDFSRIVSTTQQLKNVPLFIDDTPSITISQIRSKCRRIKKKHNLGLVVIDYIQLIGNDSKRLDTRATEVGEITRGLKAIAKEFNVPVLALSQLSRAVESRDDHIPLLSDLRESGSIEQDADVVAFIFREEYYVSRKEPNPSAKEEEILAWREKLKACSKKATIIIAKNRHGPIGNIDVLFDSDKTLFGDLAPTN